MQLTIEIPDKFLINRSTEMFSTLLKLNTAIEMYRNGEISAASASVLVGNIDRSEFLYECKKRGIGPQTYENTKELEEEVVMLEKEL
jgi:predicted HTH domain antitoxin